MQPDVKWNDRLKYKIDDLFSKGPIAQVAALGLMSLGIILIAALILTAGQITQEGETSISFIEAAWGSLMRTLDSGTMGGDTGWGFRIVMLGVTFGGIFVISAFIGVLTSGLEIKLEELRKGRSRVIETDHTIILGWSEQVFTIIPELVLANESLPSSCIVIMGDKDKVEMEEAIQAKIENTGRTRIVCRSGSPMEMADLALVSLNTARSIIVLSPETDEPDAEVIKTVLAITKFPGRREQPFHIVAELRDTKNLDVAKLVGKDEVEWVVVSDLIARIIAQTCRQSGLSVVYTEMLDFGGDEIYFADASALAGKTFGEALLCYEKNAVLGICKKDGAPALNPPMETPIESSDQLILVAEDDDKIFLNPAGSGKVDNAAICTGKAPEQKPENTVILGWNWRGAAILRELDQYVAPGSKALVVADLDDDVETDLEKVADFIHNQDIKSQRGDTTERRLLDSLDLANADHVILLCYSDVMEAHQADARTLITLLHLRDMIDKHGYKCSVVSEMMDVRNRKLAEVTRADDFVVSGRLVSLLLSQVSENKQLNAVFTDFFDPEGSEVYLKPARLYVKLDEAVNFYTVTESARRRGEVAFGYHLAAETGNADLQYGVHTNPVKSQKVTFGEIDRIIVLAES